MNLLGTVLSRVLAPWARGAIWAFGAGNHQGGDVWSYAVSVVDPGSAMVESGLSLPLGLSF